MLPLLSAVAEGGYAEELSGTKFQNYRLIFREWYWPQFKFLFMNERLRQSIIAFIWPGPIAGPTPINLYRVLSPLLVIYAGTVLAVLVMWIITSFTVIYYFRLLELTSGKSIVEKLLRKLPSWAHHKVERRGPIFLFFVGIVLGVFTYAIILRLLKYSEAKSEMLLVGISLISSVIWTGIFWGSVVEIFRRVSAIAF